MSLTEPFRRLSISQFHAFSASFLGWTLDSFDFFLLVFCVPAIAGEFHAKASAVMLAVLLTLLFRPLGAVLFGTLADRFGRKPILIVNILCFSVIEVACAFAPSLRVLLMLRALFGVAMGGVWGVGAALAFETLPAKGRGTFSGILQEGYAAGSILAAGAFAAFFGWMGWRGLFLLGALPLALVPYIWVKVQESPLWLAGASGRAAWRRVPFSMANELRRLHFLLRFLPTFLFLVLLMTAFMAFSHGTQDIYPTFLSLEIMLSPQTVGVIGVLYGFGSIAGGFVFGTLSERWGRKRTIVTAALLAIPMIPLFAYGHNAWVLGLGAVLMQFMVQGAWGVVPAYLIELTPAPMRATAPGLAYQLGGLVTAWNGVAQARIAEHWGSYSHVLATTVALTALVLVGLTLMGREAKGEALAVE